MKVVYPIDWDEIDLIERAAKGWLSGVIVQAEDGIEHELSFYDPVRLAQEIDDELAEGNSGFIERGLIVVPEVTKENIEKVISQAENEGYFQSV